MKTLRSGLAAGLAVTSLGALAFAADGSSQAGATTYPACGGASLAVTRSYVEAGTGHRWSTLLFRNTGHTTCSIYGFPGVDAQGPTGAVLGHAVRTGTPHTVVVTSGHFAVATLGWSAFNSTATAPCPHWSTYTAVTPANTTRTTRLPLSVSLCSLQVQPTAAPASYQSAYGFGQLWWTWGAGAPDYRQGYYWHNAAVDLGLAGSTYSTQIHQLNTLIALPDAMGTPAQQAERSALITSLNGFFATPQLYA